MDLNYDELYGRQDLKDLADDVSWFPEEDLDETGLVGHFEDAGEEVYRLYESDLDDTYYSDYDYEEEEQEESHSDDRDVGGEKTEEKQEEEEVVGEEKGDHQNELQSWRKRFSVRDRFSDGERTRPKPEQDPVGDSVSEDQIILGKEIQKIILGENHAPNANPSILALMNYYDRDASGETVMEGKQEEEVVEGEKDDQATFTEVVDRAQQLQDKLQVWRDIFSVHKRFPNSERTRPRPEQVPAEDSVSEDQIIFGEHPRPNANPSILALIK